MKDITIKLDDKEIKAQISDEDAEVLAPKTGRWKPKHSSPYWYLWDGNVSKSWWVCDDYDIWRYEQGNVFPTAKDAEAYRTYLQAKAKIRNDAMERNGGWKPDWIQAQFRYYLESDFGSQSKWVVATSCYGLTPGITYYKSGRSAKAVIKELHDELEIVRKWESKHG